MLKTTILQEEAVCFCWIAVGDISDHNTGETLYANISVDDAFGMYFLEKTFTLIHSDSNESMLEVCLSRQFEMSPKYIDYSENWPEIIEHEKFEFDKMFLCRSDQTPNQIIYNKESKEICFYFNQTGIYHFFMCLCRSIYLNRTLFEVQLNLDIKDIHHIGNQGQQLVFWWAFDKTPTYFR